MEVLQERLQAWLRGHPAADPVAPPLLEWLITDDDDGSVRPTATHRTARLRPSIARREQVRADRQLTALVRLTTRIAKLEHQVALAAAHVRRRQQRGNDPDILIGPRDDALMTLSVDETRNLLDLRFLHERGVQEIRHPAPGRRAVGVILLDAANERAVFEAATTLALAEKKELDAQISAVAARLGDKWTTPSRTTVSRLHKARNGVQHQGLGIDPASIEQWIAASRTFIQDIIEAVYDVSIWTLTAADAIVTPEWAGLLRAGENHAVTGRYSDAVESYGQLFAQLDRRLRGLGSGSTSLMRPFRNDIEDKKSYDFLDRRIEESARLSWFSNISVDSFELRWFENLLREGYWASKDDADRAHALIFWAVTAFESIDPTSQPNRRREWELGRRECRPADSDTPARAVSQHIAPQGDRGLRVTVSFAAVPSDEFDFHLWSSGVKQSIERGEGVSFVSVDGTGALRFSLPYQDSYESLPALIQEAIAAGEEQIRMGRAEMAERHDRRQQIVERLSPTVSGDGLPPWILHHEIGFSDVGRGGVDVPVVLLSISADLDHLPHEMSLWRYVHDQLEGVQFHGHRGGLDAFSPVERWDELIPVLQEFDRIYHERREQQALVVVERASSVEKLNAVFRSINIPTAAE